MFVKVGCYLVQSVNDTINYARILVLSSFISFFYPTVQSPSACFQELVDFSTCAWIIVVSFYYSLQVGLIQHAAKKIKFDEED